MLVFGRCYTFGGCGSGLSWFWIAMGNLWQVCSFEGFEWCWLPLISWSESENSNLLRVNRHDCWVGALLSWPRLFLLVDDDGDSTRSESQTNLFNWFGHVRSVRPEAEAPFLNVLTFDAFFKFSVLHLRWHLWLRLEKVNKNNKTSFTKN